MLFPLKELIDGRDKPLCVPKDTKVSVALALMMEHDYSQLPVLEKNGDLCGIISENAILGMYYHTGGNVSLLNLEVDHCQTPPITAEPENDIFEALDLLQNNYAIVIVENRRPVGILTNYDAMHFFRDVSEGLILIQDIEASLRQYIEGVFSENRKMQAALVQAFGMSKRDDTQSAYTYDQLSFGQHVQFISSDKNWVKFRDVFEPKKIFMQLMDQVREIRNQLAHFRGHLEPVQRDALVLARNWLASRPKLPITISFGAIELKARVETVRTMPEQVTQSKRAGKYSALEQWLIECKSEASTIQVTFEDIETRLEESLPPSAREHRSWWANDATGHVQSLAWMRAGWRVEDVNLSAERVVFRRTNSVLMQLFFAELLERLKKVRPGATRARKTFPQNWWSFGAGKSGFSFSWAFIKERKFRVELYIDTGSEKQNKAAYDALLMQKEAIETEIGYALEWERLDQRRASRIGWSRAATITDSPEKLEQIKQWAIETTLKFIDTFQHRIREL